MRTISQKFAAVFGAVAMTAGVASAQINFAGNTSFCFTTGGTTCAVFGAPTTIGGLTLNAGSFNVTTNSSGFAAIGGTGNNLGTASLTSAPFTYDGNTLQLRVDFTAPSGASSQTFTSLLTGRVEAGPTGGVRIAFSPSTLAGTFANGGSYNLSVDNISLTPNQTGVEITGAITSATRGSTVPEPSTYALMISGLAGLGMVARRRRSNG